MGAYAGNRLPLSDSARDREYTAEVKTNCHLGGVMRTRTLAHLMAVVSCLVLTHIAVAQAPAGAPAGTTGLCNDGTYYTGATKKGACRGHKGVKEWYGAPTTKSSTSEGAGSNGTSTSNAAAPSTTSTPKKSSSSSSTTEKAESSTPAPGGGPDKVWLNTATNVYHCPGTRYYGTTKAGAYMTEAEAKAKGAHADHGKPCKQ